MSPEASRDLLRSLTEEVFDHLVVLDPERRVYGMAYEFKGMPDGPLIQGFALDSMHDGAWMASAMATAARIDPEGDYLDRAGNTFIPFYINLLENSDKLFPKMRPRKGQETFSKPIKGWAPRGWDDGPGVALVPFLKGKTVPFSEGINTHPDHMVIERDEAGNYVQSYHTSSHHLFQDLADALLNVWLSTRDPALPPAIGLIRENRKEIGLNLVVVNTAHDLMSGNVQAAGKAPSFDPEKSFSPLWEGFVTGKNARGGYYNDSLAWEYRAEAARAALSDDADATLDPDFVNHVIAQVYSMNLLTHAYFGELHRPGYTLSPGAIVFGDGKLQKTASQESFLYSRGMQLPWLAAAVLPDFRKNAKRWQAAVASIPREGLEKMEAGLFDRGVALKLDHAEVVAALEKWIDDTIGYWAGIRNELGYLPRLVKADGGNYSWARIMEQGAYAHLSKLVAFRLIDRERASESALIRRRKPEQPIPHRPLPDSVLKIQGLR